MIKLTLAVTGRPVYIDPRFIAVVAGVPDGDDRPDLSGVWMSSGLPLSVKEQAEDIARRVRAVNGCGDEWKMEVEG